MLQKTIHTNKKFRKFYRNKDWIKFSKRIKDRDKNKCMRCDRTSKEVILQVHHNIYYENKKPWEYSLSDCITLCKGCHAREHNILEPTYDWTLLSISDLGELSGICERENCNTAIRYEYLAYHPQWGYKTIGSTCIEFLTEEDKLQSHQYLKLYKKIAQLLHNFNWEKGQTKKGRPFINTEYKKSIIRVYDDNSSYQLILKIWKRIPDYQIPIQPLKRKIKNINFIKEFAIINLMGLIAEEKKNEEDLEILRDIYRSILNSLKITD